MGMLQNGRWTEDEQVIQQSAYVRQQSVFDAAISDDDIASMAAEPGRFHLVASASCPWSHRALLVRRLKSLDHLVPVHIARGPRVEGYAIDGGASWAVPGAEVSIVHLHELYTLHDPSYTGRSTVPILWDSRQCRIVSNESAAIMRAFDAVRLDQRTGDHTPTRIENGTPDFTLRPRQLAGEIEQINLQIYRGLANGVYRALFAQRQDAYDLAVTDVFATLDMLEARLSSRRYLLGATITESDWRLFPTLFRFDAIYYVLHRCTERRLIDFPRLWAYARDLYTWSGVAEAVTLDAMRKAGYASDPTNAHGIVAIAPRADWRAAHGRDVLGAARIALRSGREIEVDPSALGR